MSASNEDRARELLKPHTLRVTQRILGGVTKEESVVDYWAAVRIIESLLRPVVPVPTREQIEDALAASGVAHAQLRAHYADAVLALFSPVEGNTK